MPEILYKKKINSRSSEGLDQRVINLPEPVYTSSTSIEEALHRRRSVRSYSDRSLQLSEISQLLWAAQGITSHEGGRTTPSAGALYPLEVYLVNGDVEGLAPAVYHYMPYRHRLEKIKEGDKRKLLFTAALLQSQVKNAAAVIVITADYSRTTRKYFERGRRYVHMEAGHASQNIYLEAVSLKLGTVAMGAFSDSLVKVVLGIPRNEDPLYLMPVGGQ